MRSAIRLGSLAAVAVAIALPVKAADLPVKAPIIPAPACANFGGGYVGGHVDTVQWNSFVTDQDGFFNGGQTGSAGAVPFTSTPTGFARSHDGWGGGVQAGFNWQTHCSVWGVVADWTWTRLHIDTPILPNYPVAFHNTGNLSSTLNWYGTLRGKTGIVVDNVMLYVTGGLAWASTRHTAFATFANTAVPFAVSSTADFGNGSNDNASRWGFVAGVGGEWALNSNVSIFSEFQYLSFAKRDFDVREVETAIGPATVGIVGFCPPYTNRVGGSCSFQTGDNIIVARLGLNWRFNYGTPVVARY